MDVFWNTSLKDVQVQFLTQKIPKKESKLNQKGKLGRAPKSANWHSRSASADRHFHSADWHSLKA